MGKPTRVTNEIRRFRFENGEMTQADLADRIGVTRQTVIAIEQGRYSPSLEMAFQIARVFGVPLDDVFQYEDQDDDPGSRLRTQEDTMTTADNDTGDRSRPAAWLPPRWFIRTSGWDIGPAHGHRRPVRPDAPQAGQWGMMRLRTVGRRTGAQRLAILGYFEDGPDLVTMAMNGWGEPEPAWWLNLQAQPDTTVDLVDGTRAVHGRAATGDERARLWARWAEYRRGSRCLCRPPTAGDRRRDPGAAGRASSRRPCRALQAQELVEELARSTLATWVKYSSWSL